MYFSPHKVGIQRARREVHWKALPIGLAQNVKLRRAVKAGEVVSQDDVTLDANDPTVACRREMEAGFGPLANQ